MLDVHGLEYVEDSLSKKELKQQLSIVNKSWALALMQHCIWQVQMDM